MRPPALQARGGESRHILVEMAGCNHSLYNLDAIEALGLKSLADHTASKAERAGALQKLRGLPEEQLEWINPWRGEKGKDLMQRVLYAAHVAYVDRIRELRKAYGGGDGEGEEGGEGGEGRG